MLLTEEEAREKWCPFSRAQGTGAELSHNRPDGSYNCIASGCMAWRWDERPLPGAGPECETCGGMGGDPVHICPVCKGTGRLLRQRDVIGYCGLAGRPEE